MQPPSGKLLEKHVSLVICSRGWSSLKRKSTSSSNVAQSMKEPTLKRGFLLTGYGLELSTASKARPTSRRCLEMNGGWQAGISSWRSELSMELLGPRLSNMVSSTRKSRGFGPLNCCKLYCSLSAKLLNIFIVLNWISVFFTFFENYYYIYYDIRPI